MSYAEQQDEARMEGEALRARLTAAQHSRGGATKRGPAPAPEPILAPSMPPPSTVRPDALGRCRTSSPCKLSGIKTLHNAMHT